MTCKGCKFDHLAPLTFCVNALNCSLAPNYDGYQPCDSTPEIRDVGFERLMSAEELRGIIRSIMASLGLPCNCTEEQFYQQFGELLASRNREHIVVSTPVLMIVK